MRTVRKQVVFQLGTEQEQPTGNPGAEWVTGRTMENDVQFSLSIMAGTGQADLVAIAVHRDGRTVVARADIRDMANRIWADLEEELRRQLKDEAENDEPTTEPGA